VCARAGANQLPEHDRDELALPSARLRVSRLSVAADVDLELGFSTRVSWPTRAKETLAFIHIEL
jgi:hypothetical protein